MTANVKQQLNYATSTIARVISDHTLRMTIISQKKTMSVKETRNAFQFLSTETLFQDADNFATKTVDSFETCEKIPTGHNISRKIKAGILIPPSLSEKFLRNFGTTKIMVTKTAPVYLAAILEFIIEKILSSSVQYAKTDERIRLTIRDVEMAVKSCPDINIFLDKLGITFIGGGVVPEIHHSLLLKKPRKKKAENSQKKRRFRPGTVSIREIKRIQKTSNCLTFAKLPFERLVRQILTKFKDLKCSKEVFIVIQYYIEQFMVKLLHDANLAAIHGGRVKITPADVFFITDLRGYQRVDSTPYQVTTTDTCG